jgi:hypothetical protein
VKFRDIFNRLPFKSALVRKNRREQVLDFLKLIRPVDTNHPLIRLGGEGDGGYLAPDDLEGIDACFSPGVASTADFELHLAQRRIPCFMADYSVDGLPVQHPLFRFEKKFLGPTNDGIFMTLGDWVLRNSPNSTDMILQMDIEGSEYPVILETDPAILQRFRIIVGEFHNLEELWHPKGLDLIRLAFLKLLRYFEIVHIHPNNMGRAIANQGITIPPLMEFTFLRKDRIATSRPTTRFPHPLDRQNVPHKPNFPLPECWWKH